MKCVCLCVCVHACACVCDFCATDFIQNHSVEELEWLEVNVENESSVCVCVSV